MNGIVVVNKEKGYTSRDVVNVISKKFHTKKVGHTGTLDPLATGVLVIVVGKCTKLVNELSAQEKEYVATMKLGIKTDTGDITGNIIAKKDFKVDKEKIENTFLKFNNKTYFQQVPIYSAKKINGKKLYEYARNNENVDLPKTKVTIKKIEVLNILDDTITFKALVSKGTYIRSLIEDIAVFLETYATMTELKRIKCGKFTIDESKKLDDICKNDIISIYNVLDDYCEKEIPDFLLKIINNGGVIKKEFNSKYCFYIYNRKLIAIYKESEKDKNLAKPFIMYNK